MHCTIWDVTRGCATMNEKPRAASDDEVRAYMEWQRRRLNLPDLGAPDLYWHQPRNWSRGARICIGATFGYARNREYQTGAYSIIMPGWDSHRQRVTMETLDDEGAALTRQTLPIEPKKGGVIWSRDDVRKAAGKIMKRKPSPIEKMQPAVATAGAERESAPIAAQDSLEPVEALSEAPSGYPAPVAVRRAWKERAKRREAQRILEVTARELTHANVKRDHFRQRFDTEQQRACGALVASERMEARMWDQWGKRRDNAERARTLLSRSRQAATFQSQRADVLHAQLVALRAAMADPSQPERASDVHRLMRERDEARTACAALEHRVGNMQQALEQVAAAVEEWSSRAIRAEAALRARAA
jgi:hypothetical protein